MICSPAAPTRCSRKPQPTARSIGCFSRADGLSIQRRRRPAAAPSHRLDESDELIETLSPTLEEAHFFVALSSGLIPVDGCRRVMRAGATRFEGYERREERVLGGAVTRKQRIGPDQPRSGNDFQVTAGAGEFLALGRANGEAKDAAGAQVDFTIGRDPRQWREPLLEMRGACRGLSNDLRRH